jgi:molecular chaperone DnaK
VFGKELIATANVDEVVALGAALYAVKKGDQSNLTPLQKSTADKMKVTGITNKYLGTLSVTDESDRYSRRQTNVIWIDKGEAIPCSATKKFRAMYDGQKIITVQVTECSTAEADPRVVKIIGEGALPFPPGCPVGYKIKVTLGYDENQMLQCSFWGVESGKRTDIELTTGLILVIQQMMSNGLRVTPTITMRGKVTPHPRGAHARRRGIKFPISCLRFVLRLPRKSFSLEYTHVLLARH